MTCRGFQIFLHSHWREDTPVLGNERHPHPTHLVGLDAGYCFTAETDVAGTRRRKSHDGSQSSCLTGTIAAQERNDFTISDFQVDAKENMAFAVERMNGLHMKQHAIPPGKQS